MCSADSLYIHADYRVDRVRIDYSLQCKNTSTMIVPHHQRLFSPSFYFEVDQDPHIFIHHPCRKSTSIHKIVAIANNDSSM